MKGYNVEEHIVTTEDGYMLTLHRIPNKNLNESKAVVFLGMDGFKMPLLSVASKSILKIWLRDPMSGHKFKFTGGHFLILL